MEYQFDAFISYSRNDVKFASSLQQELERNFSKIDKRLRGNKQKCLIARDEADMDVNEDLGAEIRSKIEKSKHFILICSRSSGQSYWVNEEIKYFNSLRKQSTNRHIITLIYDLPDPLSKEMFPLELVKKNIEPLAIDLRESQVIKLRKNYKRYLRTECYSRIYSKILDIDYSIFTNRQEKHRKYLIKRNILVTVCILVFANILLFLALVAGSKPEFMLKSMIKNPEVISWSYCLSQINDTLIAKGSDEGTVYLLNLKGNIDSLNGLTGMVRGLKLAPDNTSLLGIGGLALAEWNWKNKNLLQTFINPDSVEIISLDYDKETGRIVIGDDEGKLWVLNQKFEVIESIASQNSSWGRLEDVRFFKNSSHVALCYLDGPVGYYDLEKKSLQIIDYLKGTQQLNLSVEQMGEYLAFCTLLGPPENVNVLETYNIKLNRFDRVSQTKKSLGKIFCISNTNKLISFNWGGEISILNIETKKELARIDIETRERQFESSFFSIDFNEDLQIVSAVTKKNIYTYKINWTTLFGLPFPYGKYLN